MSMAEVKKTTKEKKEPVKKKVVKKEEKPVVEAEVIVEADVTDDEIIVGEIDMEKFGKDKYLEAVGRRKTSVARVRFYAKGDKGFIVNEKPYDKYFTTHDLQETSIAPLKKMKCDDKFRVTVKVTGGGVNSQAEAVRHGISRALVIFNPEFKKRLRRAGFLTRDPRQRERKKFGLKRARRAPQWKKR